MIVAKRKPFDEIKEMISRRELKKATAILTEKEREISRTNIKYFNNYYEYVRALLEEYVAAGKGMVSLQVIDPRPFSNDEVQAIRYGLDKFEITEEENFFFGLVAQTQFGVEKVIKFFTPARQNFVDAGFNIGVGELELE